MGIHELSMIGITAAVLLVLLALLASLIKQMTRLVLAGGVVLAFLALGVVLLVSLDLPALPSPVEVHLDSPTLPQSAPPSAAASITLFLMGVLAFVVVTIVVVVVGREWWQERRRQARLREALQQAQLYALLSGERVPTGSAQVRFPQRGGNVILIGGQQMTPRQDALADFLPPEADGWEVIQ
jgi:hypothetical protein